MAAPDFWSNPDGARGVVDELKQVKEIVETFQTLSQDISDQLEMIDMTVEEAPDDEALLAELEQNFIKLRRSYNRFRMRVTLNENIDRLNVYMNIHSGAGGTEACDWAAMLLRMYTRWFDTRRWKCKIIEENPDIEAGYKSVMLQIEGDHAYGYLKSEIGVHRLVRISPFDAKKRRHTSFAAVDVIPQYEDEGEIEINENELRIDTYRSSGAGGQHVNKTDSAVRITHLPTGLAVACQNERSQHKNRAMALKILKARLEHVAQMKKDEETKKLYGDKGEIAWGNQIRSYVETPYTMVKDHRTDLKRTDYQSILDGDLDELVSAYLEMNAGL
jgi:peptide chain release factor 2